MNRYTNYCTEEQTKRAYKLGAPIDFEEGIDQRDLGEILQPIIPTTQQMIGWLREKGVAKHILKTANYSIWLAHDVFIERSAIDAALNYLEKGE